MFKWLLKKWKIWKLNRKWYEVIWPSINTNHKYYIKYVCFGKMHQCVKGNNIGIRKHLRRLDDGTWISIDKDEGTAIDSSKETEKAYQNYLEELSELTLL